MRKPVALHDQPHRRRGAAVTDNDGALSDSAQTIMDKIDGLYGEVDQLRRDAVQRLDRIVRFHSSDAAPDPRCRACHQAHPCHTRLLAQGREQ